MLKVVVATALVTSISDAAQSTDDSIRRLLGNDKRDMDSDHRYYPEQSYHYDTPYENEYDIVIIGAGVTGLLHSYLLSTESDETYNTLTIERYNRLCGRTHTVDIKHNKNEIHFEAGAMRLYYNKLQQQLLKRLDLCDNIIPFEDTTIFDREDEVKGSFFLHKNPLAWILYRNHRKRFYQINSTNYWQNVFNLDQKEQEWIATGYNPAIEIGYKEILEENNHGIPPSTDEEWDDFWDTWTLRGIPVTDWDSYSFYKVIVNASVEYYRYVEEDDSHDISIADRFHSHYAEPWNASFYEDGELQFPGLGFFTLDTGYDEVCNRLYERASSYDQNEYLFEHEVVGIDYNYDENNAHKYKYVVIIEDVYGRDEPKKIYTNKVISTMPPSQLKHYLPYMIPIDNAYTRKLADSVVPYRCYKINFIYDSEFWIDYDMKNLTTGTGTDMELHGIYIEDAWTDGTLTTFQMYTRNDGLWDRLQGLGDPYENNQDIIIADDGGNILTSSKVLVDEMMKQLRFYLNISDIPYPLAAFSSSYGYNASNSDAFYHWKAGSIPDEVMNNIIKPVDDEEIYLTSSSYSPYQAWQYGAIWAALENLKQNFNIEDPFNDEKCEFPNGYGSIF